LHKEFFNNILVFEEENVFFIYKWLVLISVQNMIFLKNMFLLKMPKYLAALIFSAKCLNFISAI